MLEFLNGLFPDIWANFTTVLAILYTIWFYSWIKKHIGSAKISVVLAVIVVYFGFFTNPILLWVPVILYLLAFFGTGLFEKIPEGKEKPDYLRD